jgi:hypothetical protein
MSSKLPPKPNPSNLSLLESSLSPRDLALAQTLAQEIKEIKSKVDLALEPIKLELSEAAKDKKLYSDRLKSILMTYEGLRENFEISGIPINYVKGSTYLDEMALIEAGVPMSLIDNCRKTKPGYFVVDRKSGTGKSKEGDDE